MPDTRVTSEPIAFLNGQFTSRSRLAVSVDDTGFMLGVTVSERLRTFRGKLFRLSRHLDRFDRSLDIVGIDIGLSHAELIGIAERLVDHNRTLVAAEDDLGLILFATPGDPSASSATVCMYTDPLPFCHWADAYHQGQSLAVVDVRQVPTDCWPAELKCRSRMHYYLADREADRRHPGARAVLLDRQGFVSEASTANVLAVVEGEGLVSPPARSVLPGVTLGVNEELAATLEIPFVRRDLTVDDLTRANELLLCSTSACLWPALQLNGRPVGNGRPGPVFERLLIAWNQLVGVELAGQANRFRVR